MRPESFDDFIRREKVASGGENAAQEFQLEVCPTPDCGSTHLTLDYDNGSFIGFTCDNGCKYIVKRNAFTGDLMYFQLVDCDTTRVPSAKDARGMKFNPLGEPYADWY